MVERQTGAAALLRDAGGLGATRVVLRSCSGFMELLCDTAAFELDGCWLSVRQPHAHLHLQLPALEGACLLEAGGDAYPNAPSIWLLGRCGSPCLLMILDLASGDERAQQAERFHALRARWGERVAFATEPQAVAQRLLH